ncbi:hypothetical protein T12_16458 [Trichinella patagoniensis]|uniref:Uncharacterized protein n=1 Tax=Trichinella patagoniensis TaxID=990121 RepID=A0A0V0Z603_9BILA|nr:hypothetical protein T12_16458 [Trichinella patagoniensis]
MKRKKDEANLDLKIREGIRQCLDRKERNCRCFDKLAVTYRRRSLFVVANNHGKREAGRKGSKACGNHVEMTVRGNPPVDTGSSSLIAEYANSAVAMVNEPVQENGLLSTLKGGNVKYVRQSDLNRVALTSDTIRNYIDCRHSLLNTNNSEPGIIRQEIIEYRTEKANTLKAILQQRLNHELTMVIWWRTLLVFVNEYCILDLPFGCENITGKSRTTEKWQQCRQQPDGQYVRPDEPTGRNRRVIRFTSGIATETFLDEQNASEESAVKHGPEEQLASAVQTTDFTVKKRVFYDPSALTNLPVVAVSSLQLSRLLKILSLHWNRQSDTGNPNSSLNYLGRYRWKIELFPVNCLSSYTGTDVVPIRLVFRSSRLWINAVSEMAMLYEKRSAMALRPALTGCKTPRLLSVSFPVDFMMNNTVFTVKKLVFYDPSSLTILCLVQCLHSS